MIEASEAGPGPAEPHPETAGADALLAAICARLDAVLAGDDPAQNAIEALSAVTTAVRSQTLSGASPRAITTAVLGFAAAEYPAAELFGSMLGEGEVAHGFRCASAIMKLLGPGPLDAITDDQAADFLDWMDGTEILTFRMSAAVRVGRIQARHNARQLRAERERATVH
jgi:hypothetical protein